MPIEFDKELLERIIKVEHDMQIVVANQTDYREKISEMHTLLTKAKGARIAVVIIGGIIIGLSTLFSAVYNALKGLMS